MDRQNRLNQKLQEKQNDKNNRNRPLWALRVEAAAEVVNEDMGRGSSRSTMGKWEMCGLLGWDRNDEEDWARVNVGG